MPSVKLVKSTHQCVVFPQLGMIHYNSNQLLSIPLSYDDRAIALMDTHLHVTCLSLVHERLETRDFALLQQDPAARLALQTTCLCCGKSVTVHGPAQERVLGYHLQQCHAEPRPAIDCMMEMVIYRKKHDHLKFCDWCGIQIVPADANTEYDGHLAECPVLLHFATWLSIPFLPSSHGSDARGCSNANSGCAGQLSQSWLGLRGSKCARYEKEGSSIKELFARQRRQGGRSGQDDGTQAQEGPDGLAITEQLCALPSDSSGGHVSATAERKCSLEATTTAASGHYAIETTSDPISAENLDSKGHRAEGLQSRGTALEIESTISVGAEGRLTVPGVESRVQIPGAGWQGTEYPNGGHGESTGEDISSVWSNPHRSFGSTLCKQKQGSPTNPLEAGTRHEEWQIGPIGSCSGGELGVAIDLTEDQTTSSGTITDGRRVDEGAEEKVDHESLCLRMMSITLVNDDVQCQSPSPQCSSRFVGRPALQ